MITKLYPGEAENREFYRALRNIVGDQVFDNLLVHGSSHKDVMELCFDCWQHLHCLPLQGQLPSISVIAVDQEYSYTFNEALPSSGYSLSTV